LITVALNSRLIHQLNEKDLAWPNRRAR
jgi:hypothetical protein